jgi:hypothetical protein
MKGRSRWRRQVWLLCTLVIALFGAPAAPSGTSIVARAASGPFSQAAQVRAPGSRVALPSVPAGLDAALQRQLRTGNTWSRQHELTSGDGAANDCFGCSLALSADGTTALIGAYAKTVGGNEGQGVVYVFSRSGGIWSLQRELVASDSAVNDNFGWSVALSANGNTALVGAHFKTVGMHLQQGVAYVFTRSGSSWSQQRELVASDGATMDFFGWSVALSANGNTALVGAYAKTVGGNQTQGVAYVFTRSIRTWSQQSELTASDGAMWDHLGWSVALSASGATALVGADFKNGLEAQPTCSRAQAGVGAKNAS